jgi:hypothetical protein
MGGESSQSRYYLVCQNPDLSMQTNLLWTVVWLFSPPSFITYLHYIQR